MLYESNGRFAYSSPVEGTAHDVSNALGKPGNLIAAPAHMSMLPPPHVRMVGMYHTHGAESWNYNDEAFSADDRRSSYQLRLASYLGTPSGRVLRYDPLQDVMKQDVTNDPYHIDFGYQIGTVPCR